MCVPYKTEDLNLNLNQHDYGNKLIKNIIFQEIRCNSCQLWNNDKCQCGLKNVMYVEKDVWKPPTCNDEM